jgi:hypothetical protein
MLLGIFTGIEMFTSCHDIDGSCVIIFAFLCSCIRMEAIIAYYNKCCPEYNKCGEGDF